MIIKEPGLPTVAPSATPIGEESEPSIPNPTSTPLVIPTAYGLDSDRDTNIEILLELKQTKSGGTTYSLETRVRLNDGTKVSLRDARISNCHTSIRAGLRKERLHRERRYAVDLTKPRRVKLVRTELPKRAIYLQGELECEEILGSTDVRAIKASRLLRRTRKTSDKRAIRAIKREFTKLARRDAVQARARQAQ